jgi:phospholipid/cholesterol/gamma-HCH transport system permease protein
MHTDATAPSPLTIAEDDHRAALRGALNIHTLVDAERRLASRARKHGGTIDITDLSVLDTPGALLLCELQGNGIDVVGASAEHQALIDLVCNLKIKPLPKAASVPRWRQLVVGLGKGMDHALVDTTDVIAFVARVAHSIGHALGHPAMFRLPSISRHVEETGIHALPIVGLMALMISVVIGYQGVAQLRQYGGEEFTINLVSVSMLREMGVLITAIMVAGRSGSAFAAEIGVMRSREEVDALRTMGMDPMGVLVLPRVIALVITLPLLTVFADAMGLFGGAMISRFLLEVSPLQYVERVHQAVVPDDLLVGFIKAPIFGFLIAVIGCMHGLRVNASAESVGRETTAAVVKAIFVVIVLDALFSILFDKLGL